MSEPTAQEGTLKGAAALRALTDEQLVQQLADREHELVGLRFRHSMRQLENTASLRQLRGNIARLKTEVRVREVAAGRQKGSLTAAEIKAMPAVAGSTAAPAARGGFLKGIVDKLTGNE